MCRVRGTSQQVLRVTLGSLRPAERVQGMGWACMEELKWGDSAHPWVRPGALMTNGPGVGPYTLCSALHVPLYKQLLLADTQTAGECAPPRVVEQVAGCVQGRTRFPL